MGKKGTVIGISIVMVVVGVISVSLAYNNMKNAQENLAKSKDDLKKACFDDKNSLIQAGQFSESNTDPRYQQNQNDYNTRCGDITGKVLK